MTDKGGGNLVPSSWVDQMLEHGVTDNLYRLMFPPPEPVRLTWRVRLSMKLWDLRYALARRLYPFEAD